MVLNNREPYSDDSENGDDPWEIVGEIARLATSQNRENDVTIATAAPGGAEREPSLEADAPYAINEGDVSIISGMSSITRDHHSCVEGGDGVNNEEVQEPADSPPDSPEILFDGDEETPSKTGEEINDDSGELDELVPPSLVTETPDAPGITLAAGALVTENSPSPTTAPAASFPAAGSAERGMEEETLECPGLVDSLSTMGFEKEQIENAIGDLREAGSEIDADSVIGEMTGEPNDSGRTWNFAQATAREFEPQHELRRRTAAASVPAAESSGDDTEEETPERLVDSLSSMGFEKERIEKAIGNLRDAGSDIDADSVVGEMTGEAHERGRAWDVVRATVRDFEAQHALRRRAGELLSAAREDARRRRATVRDACERAGVHARIGAAEVREAAASAGDAVRRANEEHRLLEKAAAAAVAGGAVLLALGRARAGVGVLAVASTVVAGGAMRQSAAQSTSTRTRDYGLREGVHLD